MDNQLTRGLCNRVSIWNPALVIILHALRRSTILKIANLADHVRIDDRLWLDCDEWHSVFGSGISSTNVKVEARR